MEEPAERDVSSATTDEDTRSELTELFREHLPEGKVSREELAEIVSMITIEVTEQSHFKGPLPPPQILAEYNSVVPGLAERIVTQAEKEQDHRHEMGKRDADLNDRYLTHAAWRNYIGQAAGLVIAMTAIGGGIYLSTNGYSTAGLATIITALVGLVTVFVVGKWMGSKEQSGEEFEVLPEE